MNLFIVLCIWKHTGCNRSNYEMDPIFLNFRLDFHCNKVLLDICFIGVKIFLATLHALILQAVLVYFFFPLSISKSLLKQIGWNKWVLLLLFTHRNLNILRLVHQHCLLFIRNLWFNDKATLNLTGLEGRLWF